MPEEPMTLIDRLRNPHWENLPGGARRLHIEDTLADMGESAARIERLETAINRYLAGDTHCNGGAQLMFEEAIG
jgi:hypothetical protein